MDNTTLDFALMAGEAYFYKRNDTNKFPIPQGASLLSGGLEGGQLSSGFEARAYDYNGKIVISFAGTYFPDRFLSGLTSASVTNNDQAGLKDWVANVQLGAGGLDSQLRDAALYYQQIKEANPGKEVVFTGHSLGGGLNRPGFCRGRQVHNRHAHQNPPQWAARSAGRLQRASTRTPSAPSGR